MRMFVVDGDPIAKGRPRFTRNGRAYTPKATKEHEDKMRECYLKAYPDAEPYAKDVPLKLIMTFEYAIPKSFSKKQRAEALVGVRRPAKKPDLDNLVKTIDALNTIAFHDDSQFVDVKANKWYSEHPRTRIIISEIKDEDKTKESERESREEGTREDIPRYDCPSY